MPVSSRGPRRRRSWWCHTCSSTPSTRTPAKRAGSSDAACRHGLIWDHTVFHVVPSWRARPAMVAPSKRNCRIAQRIARTPRRALGAHTEWFCSVKVAIWQVCSRHIHQRLCHRIRAGTPARGASITSTTTRPWPCAIQPTTRAANQLVARLNIEHESIWGASYAHQMEALQTDEQITPITPITPIKRGRAAAGRVRHRPRSLDDSGGKSPLIIKDLDLYTQPPTNNRSPTLNSEEPVITMGRTFPRASLGGFSPACRVRLCPSHEHAEPGVRVVDRE